MNQLVVRRFDVQVEQPSLLVDVRRALGGEVRIRPEIRQVGRSLLEVRLEGSAADVSAIVTKVAETGGVRVHHDRVRPAKTPDRPFIPVGAARPTGGSGPGASAAPLDEQVVVAVVDSGMMVEHPSLEGHLWKGFADGQARDSGARCIGGVVRPDVTDEDGHGTRLAGTILAAAGGAEGVRLMAVKFFDADARPGPVNGAAAIAFATKAQPRACIINLSWNLGIGSPALEAAIQAACAEGILVVIAAGNSGSDNDHIPTIPAEYRRVWPGRIITVMATDRYDEKASFSNYGATTVDLAAPGVDILTTRASLSKASRNELEKDPSYRWYRSYNGTSAAAALVTGAAARLKSRNPELTADDLKVRLYESVRRMPGLKSKCITGGILKIEAP
jgi:subtilisin family serine protease